MNWFKKLGLKKNPFVLDPSKFKDRFMFNKNHLDNLIYWIKASSIVVVRGPKYSGKTKLVLELRKSFSGKIIYIDLNKYNKQINIGSLLIKSQPLHRRLLNLYPKNMILILDNTSNFAPDFYKRLQYFFDEGYIKSLIFVYKSNKIVNMPLSLVSRIGNKYIDLNSFNKQEAIQIIDSRLKGKVFSNEHLEFIYDKSEDFESFVVNCEKIAQHLAYKDNKDVDFNFIRKVLN